MHNLLHGSNAKALVSQVSEICIIPIQNTKRRTRRLCVRGESVPAVVHAKKQKKRQIDENR